MQPSSLQLELDSYDGPFDLLCTLLLRREVPVEDIPLVEIVIVYVEELAKQLRVDPDTASEFLLLVAGLMEIKARELLTQEIDLQIEDPASLEAQDEMLERLVRYATFKNVAQWFSGQCGHNRWWRQVSRVPRKAAGPYEGPVMDPELLRRSMAILLAQPDVDVRHLVGRHASVGEMTSKLLTAIRQRRTFALEETFEGLNRLDQAVAFIAALELCKNGHIELHQESRFGPIMVSRNEGSAQENGEVASDVEASPAAAG